MKTQLAQVCNNFYRRLLGIFQSGLVLQNLLIERSILLSCHFHNHILNTGSLNQDRPARDKDIVLYSRTLGRCYRPRSLSEKF